MIHLQGGMVGFQKNAKDLGLAFRSVKPVGPHGLEHEHWHISTPLIPSSVQWHLSSSLCSFWGGFWTFVCCRVANPLLCSHVSHWIDFIKSQGDVVCSSSAAEPELQGKVCNAMEVCALGTGQILEEMLFNFSLPFCGFPQKFPGKFSRFFCQVVQNHPINALFCYSVAFRHSPLCVHVHAGTCAHTCARM